MGGGVDSEGEDGLGFSVEHGSAEVVGMLLIRVEGIGAEGVLDAEAVSVLVVVHVEDAGEVGIALVFHGAEVVVGADKARETALVGGGFLWIVKDIDGG